MKFAKHLFIVLIMAVSIVSCQNSSNVIRVETNEQLYKVLEDVKAGDEIVLANGEWKNLQVVIKGKGTKQKPITLRAEADGKVLLTGRSNLKISGEYITVRGLYFTNGYTPDKAVIQFKTSNTEYATHCRVTECAIKDYSKPERFDKDHWVGLWGRYNRLDHNYFAGKANQGVTLIVFLEGNEHKENYHLINNNFFGYRLPLGSNGGETIRVGDSFTSMVPSHTMVKNNYFEHCSGEVEIISNKACNNTYEGNIFYECEGSLVMRHGNYCNVNRNIFIGNNKPHTGGVRIINTGYNVTNNYFFGLAGDNFRSGLTIMNGVYHSPMNRYNQVTDVTVAFNTWINCKNPIQLCVGSDEERTLVPIRTTIANNIIYNEKKVDAIVSFDKTSGITFAQNIVYSEQKANFINEKGITEQKISFDKSHPVFWYLEDAPSQAAYVGYGFDKISEDLFGNSRSAKKDLGAINMAGNKEINEKLLNKDLYGPQWFDKTVSEEVVATEITASNSQELEKALTTLGENVTLLLKAGATYVVDKTIFVDNILTIKGEGATIHTKGRIETLFQLREGADLILQDINIQGDNNVQYVFATASENMSKSYTLALENVGINDFTHPQGSVFKAYKGSFANFITIADCKISNVTKGLDLSAEVDDKGIYNAENVTIVNTTFERVRGEVIDYYRGGSDESTVGGTLIMENTKVYNSGSQSKQLLKTTGIIYVKIKDCLFKDNSARLVAKLKGNKNKVIASKTINSGKIELTKGALLQ